MDSNAVRKPQKDIMYSVAALVLYNGVIQLAIYPFFNSEMGAAAFGVVLSLHSILVIIAGACGGAANNSRMITQLRFTPSNGDYNFILLFLGLASMIAGIICFAVAAPAAITPAAVLLYAGLMFFMLLRHYGDVEFRLRIDFKRYFIYYLLISVGYLLGLYIYHVTGQWMFSLLAGEILAIGYVIWKGHIFAPPVWGRTQYTPAVWKSITFLLVSNLISLLIVNADRIVLLFFEGGTAVTAYYVASLLGKLVALLTGPLSGVMLSYLVRYDGALSRRMFLQGTGLILVMSAVAFVCCFLLSPWLIGWLYPASLEMARPILALAIAGQIIYFAAGILRIVLLRFHEEKYQTYLNVIYGVGFFTIIILALIFGGLNEFAWAVLIANISYFLLMVGFGLYKIDKNGDSTKNIGGHCSDYYS
jgi:O-antigen/teichoic acid export membrane protein